MFVKYLNKFGKAEAEWVQEILDMHGGDEPKAKQAVIDSLTKHIEKEKGADVELTAFDQTIRACCFASGYWWDVGLNRLRELGRFPAPPS